jgi:hypothetical protein
VVGPQILNDWQPRLPEESAQEEDATPQRSLTPEHDAGILQQLWHGFTDYQLK